MTVLLRRFYATLLVLCALSASSLLAQSGASTPDRTVSPVRTDLPGRTVWAFATSASAGTGTGTNITTFAATDKGLYKSSGGAWSLTSLDKQSVYAVKSRDIGRTSTLLVGTDKGVLRSTDGGNTWASPEVTTGTAIATSNIVSLKKVFDIEIVQLGNGNGSGNAGIWFAATEKGVYRSSNDGRSWSLVNIDRTADNNEVRGITVDGSTIIVNLWKEGLWRSTNNGNSWTKLTIPGETALCRAVHAQQGTNATIWLAGSVSGNIWRSVNSGTSWSRVYQGTSAARNVVASSLSQAGIDAFTGYANAVNGKLVSFIFASTAQGIATSTDDGQKWSVVQTQNTKAISLVAFNNTLYIGAESEPKTTALAEGKNAATLTLEESTGGGAGQYTIINNCNGIYLAAYINVITPTVTIEGQATTLSIYGCAFTNLKSVVFLKNNQVIAEPWLCDLSTGLIFNALGIPVDIFGNEIVPTVFNCLGASYPNGRIDIAIPTAVLNSPGDYEIQIGGWLISSNKVPFTVKPALKLLNIGASLNSIDTVSQALQPVTLRPFGFMTNTTRLLVNGIEPANIQYSYRTNVGFQADFTAPAVGTYSITLTDGTQTSNAKTWIVTSSIPALQSVTTSPSPARVGQTATMTVGGQKFAADAQVRIYGPNNTVTTYNPTTRTGTTGMTVSFTPPTTPGVYAVDVVNPGASSPSEQTTYMVAYPAPTLTAISPTRVIQNLPMTLSLTGTGILAGVTEFGLSSGLSSTLSGASVTFTAPAKGTYSASLTNATTYGGGGTATLSNALTVVAPNPAPASLTLDSTRLLVNDGVRTLTLTGTGFLTGSNSDDNARTAVTVDGASITPQSISATQIVLSVPTAGANAGAHTIALTNPAVFSMASGGGGTASTTYSVAFPPPTLTSLDADSLDLNIGTTPQTLTLTGTGFVNASRVFAGARELTVSSRTATSLVITIPSGFFTEPATVAVRVDNPVTSGVTPTDGGSSGTKSLTIKNLLPTLTSISPALVVAGENATLTLAGSNFIANTSQVFAGTTALVTTVSSASSLTATLPASLVADIGTLSLTVRNTFGTDIKTSLPKSLRVIHPTPEVTNLAPEHSAQVTIPAFDSTQTLTITGAKFAAASMVPTRVRVVWSKNGVETPLTLLPNPTATQLRVTVPAALLTELGSVTVRVQNVDSADAQGGPSASSTLTIIPPRPVVTSVTPNSATAGAGAVTVTITGAKFIQSGLSILIRNAQNGFVRGLLNPTFTGNTSVSGMIPADVVTLAGNYTITVVNAANANSQGGGESTTSAPFTILNPAPTIASLTPNPATVFAPFTLEIQGTGFVSGATSIVVDGQTFPPASVAVLSSVRLTVNVAAITSAKNAGVSVTNPKLNNQGGGTATSTIPVVPPVPTVSGASGNAGSGTLTRNVAGTLTVTGTGFVTGAVIIFNGQDLTTTVVDQTTVRANVAASALPTQGVYAVAVRNPQFGGQGGGTSSPVVGVTVQNPTPTLSSISPTAVTRGNDASITLTGSNFYDGAVAYLSGASSSTFATVFVNTGSLTLSIPASSLPVAGSYSIAVKNAEPTPGFSGTKTLTVNNPAPVLSSLSVIETEAYSSDVTLTVTGSGFENGLMAWWTPTSGNPQGTRQALPAPTSVSANSCTLSIPAAMLTRAGAFTITLENAAPSLGASAPSTFTVLDRVPTLTSVTPNPIEALSGNTQITLTGDYFAPTADALWNGEVLARVSVNRTTLVATVPASRLTLATVAQITVRNPQLNTTVGGRGGGTSTPAQNLVITNPAPHLTSLTPAFIVAVTSGTGAVVTLNGTGFMPGAPMVHSTVEMSVSDSTGTPSGVWSVFPSTYQSASRISVFLPDALLHQPVVFTLRVVSPQVSAQGGNPQGGGTSEERLFTVRAPVPVLTALVPTVATLNAQTGDVVVRVEGANFTNTSLVRITNVPVPTRYLSPTALEATVQRPAAAYTVTVNNPPVNAGGIPQGGGTSSGLRLVLVNPVPTLSAVQPSTLASTGAPDTLTLKGTNFITGVKVLYNGTALAAASVTVVNDSTLRVLIPALPIAVTTHTLAVQQPSVITGGETFGGSVTVALPLSIVFPVPTLTSLSPQSTAATLNPNAAPSNWTLTVRGTLFANNAVVLWNGQSLTTSVVNSTTLRALVPNSLAQDSGTALIRVKNDVPTVQGGGTSADSLTLGIYYPVPVLTGIAPDFTTAATLTRLTLTGTNFAPGSGVQLSATFLPAVMLGDVRVISPTELQASIPATLLGTRGTYSVRVISPPTASAQGGNPVGGGQSAAKTLTAVNPAPVLTALLPNTTTASGKAWTLTLVGRSFTATSQVRYNGVLQSLVNTDFIPNVQSDTLRVKLPAVPVNDTTFFLSVYNPPSTVNGQPSGGGESDTLRLAIGLPSPTITSISPATTTATLGDRARAWTLTINGTFFDNAAKVFVGGVEVPSEFVAATRLRVVLPDSMQFFQARRTVQVKNTPTLTSNLVSLTVQNPAPVLTTIAPSTILAGRDTTIVFAGDRFAPTSTVRLTYGTTNTFLTPTLRDSVIGLTVTIPGALTRTKGAYTLRVSNPALAPTMVPPDTLLLGGGFSAAQTLTVNAGGAASVEYIGLDTLLYAGDRLWFFTLRFRDAVGNLVDNDPVTLTYTNVDTTSTNGTSITGTFSMTRTSLGNYRADTLRFPVAGVYALTVDTAQTGALTIIGANRFTVLTRPAIRVDMTGLKETLSAGETQHVQARYYDNQNNLTDNSVRPVIVTAPLAGGYRYVLGYTRLRTGVYDMETVRYTTSGNYTISFTGIDTLNITGNGVPYNRRFTVQTIPAASVRFTNVNPFLTAGNAQNRFTAAFRDTFGNLTDALTTEQLVVQYSNSTTASVGDSIVTGAITLSRLNAGTYQADVAERFPVVGSYNLTVQGISSTSGTAAFRVQAAGDARVEFAGVRDTLVAGDSLQNVTLKYWDVNGNLTDNNLGDIILTKRSPAPTFPARMAKTRLSTGVYAVQTTQATISGNYDLTVLGITAANTGGKRTVVVVPASVTNVDFVITTTAMTRTGARAYITATYHDRFGNLADGGSINGPGDLTLSNSEYASVATVSMTRSSLGRYTGSITLYAPGAYAVQIAGNSANITIGGTEAFALEPGPAVRADFQNVLPALTAGANQSAFTVLLRDRRGSPTDVWNGAIAFDAPASGVTGTVSYDWDNGNPAMYGVITATPTAFTKSGAYTFSLNGGITQHVGTRTFAVSAADAQTAYILTTPANATVTAGGTVSLRVRFTDSFGNLAPVTNSIMLQQAGTTLATTPLAATGTKGEYTSVFRPATSGTLTFALDTPVMQPALMLAGTTAITVLPTTDYRVELNGVKTQMIAGETQNPFTVTYRDRYGNLTDSTVGAVIVRLVGGTERDTLTMQRLAKGEYKAEALTVTKAGTYLITISGISTLNITGDSAFVVTPDVAAQAVFQNVPTAINVGANLPAFTVRYRDRFDNPVEYQGIVSYTNIGSPLVQSGIMPLNTGVIPTTRTAVAVSTATATTINTAGDYTFAVQGITTFGGTSKFTVRPLAAVSAEIGNVQERVPAGTKMKPFSVIYRDRLGNVTDYNKNVTFTNVDNPSISGTIVMGREAIGVSTATASTLFATEGTYRLSVSGLSTISGATKVIVASTVAIAQVRFWDVPQNTIAGDSVESFYVAFLNTNAEYKDFGGILRYTHPSGSPSGILALTKVDTGIYKTDKIALIKAGTYKLTVDNISITTGTASFAVSPDTTVIRTVVDSLRTDGALGEPIPPFTIAHFDRFDNPIINPPQATTVFVSYIKKDSVAVIPTAITPQGALYIGSQTFSSTGSFQVQAEKNRLWTGNRRIQIYAPKPIITAISPKTFVLGSTAVVTILGRNFADDCSVWYGGQQLDVQKLENGRLLVYIHQSLLLDSTHKDSLIVVNESGVLGQSNKWGARLTASAGITNVKPSKSTIDDPAVTLKVIGTGFQDLLKTANFNYKIRITNSANISRDFGGVSENDTIFVDIDQEATVRAFRDLGSGTHTVSIINDNKLPLTSLSNAFFIANPVPEITSITDLNDDEISTTVPFDIQATSFINEGWLTMKIHGTGLVKDSIANIIQSTIQVVRVNKPDSACTVEVVDKSAIYDGNNSSITIRLKIGDNIIPQGKNKEDYRLTVINKAFQNGAGITAGAHPEGGGSDTLRFTIEDSGPEIISFNPPIVRAASDTVRTITIKGKRFQQGAKIEFKNPDGKLLTVNTTFISDSSLQVRIALGQVGDYILKVINPDKSFSRLAPFPVGNFYPKIYSISPDGTSIGQEAKFTISGRGFIYGVTKVTMDDNNEWLTINPSSSFPNDGVTQKLDITIRERLVTFGRHKLTVYNDTTYGFSRIGGVGGQDTTSIAISSVIPHLDSLRPQFAVADSSIPDVIIYGSNLSSQTKVLVEKRLSNPNNPIEITDSMSVTYTPPTNTTKAFIRLSIPGYMIKEGDNYLYAVNPGGFRSQQAENLLLIGRAGATVPKIIRLEPSTLKPQDRDTTVRIVGKNFDSTAQVFCFYLDNRIKLLQSKLIGDSVLIVIVPKELINKKDNIPFTVVGGGIASGQVFLSVNNLIPIITALKTEYTTREDKISNENFLGGGFYQGKTFSVRRDNNIYAGSYSEDLGTKVILTGVIFPIIIVPPYILPIPLFPKYYKQELQNMFIMEGNDLNGIRKLFIDGIEIKFLAGTANSKILGKYEGYFEYISNNEYKLSRLYKIRYPYTLFNGEDLTYSFFILDTLSIGKHNIQAEIIEQTELSDGLRTNIFEFEVKPRLTTHIERLELETSRANFTSTPFSSLTFSVPSDTVKYIYIIAPKDNAAFTRQSSVLFNNYPIPFEYINHGVLRAKVTPEFAYNGGSNNIAVINPGGYAIPASVQNFTAQINFAEGQPDSKVTSIEPTSLPVANRDTTITVRGIGFTPFVNVLLHHTVPITNTDENGNEVPDWTIEETPLAISNVTPSSMTVTIPARFRNSVTIDTLIIGHLRWGRRADTVFLPIRSIISVSSVQPNILEADIQGEPIQRDTLTIRGNGFDAATKIWTGQEFLNIIGRSDTVLRAIASQWMYSSARNVELGVSNGNTEAQVSISVQYPRPIIDSISPRLIEVASPALIASNDAKFGSSLTSGDTQDLRPVAGVEEIITEPKLYPNAPNPFDNRTELSYRLPDDGRVKIEVIDRFGAIVATLVNEQKRLGSYTTEWNAQGLPSGTYYARMTVVNSKGKVTQKIQSMTLIR